jgi:DNA-binding MurR/RpiR family transcriptional regulator
VTWLTTTATLITTVNSASSVGAPVITVTLLASELSDIIDCVTNAADRAESSAYDMAGTPRAKQLAQERAKRLYALAGRLLAIR